MLGHLTFCKISDILYNINFQNILKFEHHSTLPPFRTSQLPFFKLFLWPSSETLWKRDHFFNMFPVLLSKMATFSLPHFKTVYNAKEYCLRSWVCVLLPWTLGNLVLTYNLTTYNLTTDLYALSMNTVPLGLLT